MTSFHNITWLWCTVQQFNGFAKILAQVLKVALEEKTFWSLAKNNNIILHTLKYLLTSQCMKKLKEKGKIK